MVEISVIVPKKTAPMSPIMVHTCGSVTLIMPLIIAGRYG